MYPSATSPGCLEVPLSEVSYQGKKIVEVYLSKHHGRVEGRHTIRHKLLYNDNLTATLVSSTRFYIPHVV